MRYAAYGSNLHPVRLCARVSSAASVGIAMAPGWTLAFHKRGKDGSGKCNIAAGPGSVFFAVFDIDDRGKALLDKAEGLGFGYQATHVELPGFGKCFSYIASESHIQEELDPYSWYKELVIVGLEYHQAPSDYLENIRAIPCNLDIDMDRHDRNMKIVETARKDT